jgi:phage tail sheath protein FI
MPEYLSPGVYVEEVQGGSKAIEGVSTSTAAFLGETIRGPVEPRLITNFGDFKRIYGGSPKSSNLATAVNGFFENGGSRCYITRITSHDRDDVGSATLSGSGNRDVMQASAKGPGNWADNTAVVINDDPRYKEGENEYFEVSVRYWGTDREAINEPASAEPQPAPDIQENYDSLTPEEAAANFYEKKLSGSSLIEVEQLDDGRPDSGLFWLGGDDSTTASSDGGTSSATSTQSDTADPASEIPDDDELDDLKYSELQDIAEPFDVDRSQKKDDLKEALQEIRDSRTDGGAVQTASAQEVSLSDYQGTDIAGERTGLAALKQIDDVSIVCIPDENDIRGLTEAVVTHCENMGDRFAILSAPRNAGRISELETPVDSQYAAYYYPWIEVKHPVTNVERLVPPTGHVAGMFARNDGETGVHGSPANMVVRGALGLQHKITKGEQDILNPKGVNCIRSFQGRGIRVWGARTCSSDPEWKYVNVRRLFLYIEQSIDEGTQWAVFEPNDRDTWARVRQSVSNFLETAWRDGALMGTSPDEAFFVKCGEETMTQDDIDNGRLICEIGIAPVKPAEFVIFRIQQWTEEASP